MFMPLQSIQRDALPAGCTATGSLSLCLDFHGSVPTFVRQRMTYAFRVFAAIYGHAIVGRKLASSQFRFLYGGHCEPDSPGTIVIPSLYRCKSANDQPYGITPPVRFNFAGESFPLFLGADPITGNPDWLGEIFLWLSGELESGAKQRDSARRIPFSETPFGRHGLSPR